MSLATEQGLGTKPPDLPDADDGAGERGEGEVDIGTSLVADGKAARLGEPSQGVLDFPAVSVETFAGVDAAPGDPRNDAAGAALSAAATMVVGLVGLEFVRAAVRPSCYSY